MQIIKSLFKFIKSKLQIKNKGTYNCEQIYGGM
jgi:hypothetical protein